jgi:NTP pyrophosphatase (non-canonical NTP hydrolase)
LDNKADLRQLENTREGLGRLRDSFEELRSEVQQKEDDLQAQLQGYVEVEELESLEQQMDDRYANASRLNRTAEELQERVDAVESEAKESASNDRVDALQETLDDLSQTIKHMSVAQIEGDGPAGDSDLRKEMEDIKSRMNELMDYVEDRTVTKSDVRKIVNVELETWDESEVTTELRPDQIDEGMKGSRVQVQGELEFQKRTEEAYLYTLKGSDGWIIVRSQRELDTESGSVDGEVSE